MAPKIVDDPEWTTNITTKCPKENIEEAYGAKSMLDVGITAVGFGSYFGLILHARFYPLLTTFTLTDEKAWKPLVRLLVAALLCAPLGILYLTMSADVISNVYVLMVLKTFLPCFGGGFILFGVQDVVNMKLGLLKFEEGDISLRASSNAVSSKGEVDLEDQTGPRQSLLTRSEKDVNSSI